MESVSSHGGDVVENLEAPFVFFSHFQNVFYFALGFFFLRLFLDRFVFHRIAVWLLSTSYSHPLKLKDDDDATRVKIIKCKESLWKLLYYAACELFVLEFVYPEPCFFRIGSIILAIHDASDVFMESAKIFKYSGKELGASVCFGLFSVSWFLLRLVYFPFWIIRATSSELLRYLDMASVKGTLMYYAFNTMLLMLLVFHIFWWYLICAMILRQLQNRGKVGEDIRSDSEDDD